MAFNPIPLSSLQIFFPRSVEGEIHSRHATRERSQSRSRRNESRLSMETYHRPSSQKHLSSATTAEPDTPMREREYGNFKSEYAAVRADAPAKANSLDIDLSSEMPHPSPVFAPNRRTPEGVVLEGRVVTVEPARLTERALAAHDGAAGVHPFLHNFTSPIGKSLVRAFRAVYCEVVAVADVGCFVAVRSADIMDGTRKTWYVKRQHAGYGV